jgi:hypothetical protein
MPNELRRELAAPAEEVAPRLVDDIQLLAVEGFHAVFARELNRKFPCASRIEPECDCAESQSQQRCRFLLEARLEPTGGF